MKKPALTVLIPVFNEAENLPKIFFALEKQIQKDFEILFINNQSTDTSTILIKNWIKKTKNINAKLLSEPNKGFAEPLKLGVQNASAELIATLDADAIPSPDWTKQIIAGLQTADIVVGETNSLLTKNPTNVEKLADIFFQNYSQKTAHADGFALPWGPTCNLGIRAQCFEEIGEFSEHAGAAFDIDWCWRAILQGLQISYSNKIKVKHKRRASPEALFNQMYRYGTGEAWIQYRFAGLLNGSDSLPGGFSLNAAIQASERIQNIKTPKNLLPLLKQASTAFACGVFDGHRNLKKSKSPEILVSGAIGWKNKNQCFSIFVPGKGVLDLDKNTSKIWPFYKASKTKNELAKNLSTKLKISSEEAQHTAEEFWDALQVAY